MKFHGNQYVRVNIERIHREVDTKKHGANRFGVLCFAVFAVAVLLRVAIIN